MRFVRVGKKDLALGLFWQIAPSQKVIRERAEKLQMSAYATVSLDEAPPVTTGSDTPSGPLAFLQRRSTPSVDHKLQVGFGEAQDLKRHKGAISAAALVATASGEAGNYFASFRLGKDAKGDMRYWHLAIRDGSIQPDGDSVVNEEDYNRLVAEHEGVFGDQVVHQCYSEAELGKFLAQFIDPNIPRQITIKKITPKKVLIRNMVLAFVCVTVLIVGGVAGMKAYKRHIASHQNQIAQERQAMLREQAKKRRIAKERKEALKAKPWKSEMLPVQFAAMCHTDIDQVPYNVNGWLLNSWSCTRKGKIDKQGNVTVSFKDGYDKSEAAGYSGLPSSYQLTSLKALSGPNATLSAPAETANIAGHLISETEAYKIYDFSTSMGWKINFTTPDPKAQFKTIGSDKLLLPWSKWGFIASGQSWPFMFIRQLHRIPTARVIAMQATFNSDNTISWIITGVIYVNNPNFQGS